MFSSELVENTGHRACFLGPPFCCNLPLVSGPDGVLKGGDIVCFASFLRPPFQRSSPLVSVFLFRCMVERACRKHRACAVFSVRPVRSSEFVQNTAPVQCFGCMVGRTYSKHCACAVVSVRIVETTALLLCFARCGQAKF